MLKIKKTKPKNITSKLNINIKTTKTIRGYVLELIL
tara:strand:+ start:499 stop:606 length:108 start_codon:yes stop_codon:yes gene_type:complete